MSIQKISKEQLRRMGDQEGLILQGCGGDPQEWVDGINEILTEEGILKKGARFEDAYTFQHDGLLSPCNAHYAGLYHGKNGTTSLDFFEKLVPPALTRIIPKEQSNKPGVNQINICKP